VSFDGTGVVGIWLLNWVFRVINIGMSHLTGSVFKK